MITQATDLLKFSTAKIGARVHRLVAPGEDPATLVIKGQARQAILGAARRIMC